MALGAKTLQHHIYLGSPYGVLGGSILEEETWLSHSSNIELYKNNDNQDSKVSWVLLTIMEA